MTQANHILKKLDLVIEKATRYAVITSIIAIMILLSLGIFVRFFPLFSMAGYDEIVEFLFTWMVFLGTLALWRKGSLFKVEIVQKIPTPFAVYIHLSVDLLMLSFAIIFTWWGYLFAANAMESTPFLMFRKNAWFFSMPVSGILMAIYSLVSIFNRLLTLNKN